MGDRVLSRDAERSGPTVTEAKQVTQTSVRNNIPTLSLTFSSGETIETTSEHPFYLEGQGFVPAGRLSIGNAIVTRAGPAVKVVKVERHESGSTVYNFTVADDHTYFVGKQSGGLWVHNVCVYRAFNRAGEVIYVGITNNFLRRVAQHGRRFQDIRRLTDDSLTREAARGVEQALINHYGLQRNGGRLVNRINSIARNNPIYQRAVTEGEEILRRLRGFRF